MTAHITSIHFRPTSWPDFSNYAKSLSRAIKLPLQKSQELLARAYGYSSLHEFQEALKTSGPPGPFDNERSDDEVHAKLIVDRAYHRNTRVNELVADYLNVCESELSLDGTLDAVEKLCLFCSPADQRRGEELLALNLAVKAGLKADSGGSPWDYVVARNEDIPFGEYLKGYGEPCFTRLGQALYDAAYEIVANVDPIDGDLESNFEKDAKQALFGLCQAHPENPWLFSVYLSSFGRILGQMEWAWDFELDWGRGLGGCAERYRYERAQALCLLPQARSLVRQAGRLIAKNSETPIGYAHDNKVRRPGGDGHKALIAGLYWAGRAALNAGEMRLAYKAFMLLGRTNYRSFKKISPSLGLAVSSILCKQRDLEIELGLTCLVEPDALESLAIAINRFREKRRVESATWLGWALANGLKAEQFVGLVDRLKGNKKALDKEEFTGEPLQELCYRTRSVWAKESALCEFLTTVARDPELQKVSDRLAPYLKKCTDGKAVTDEDIANRKAAVPIHDELKKIAKNIAAESLREIRQKA